MSTRHRPELGGVGSPTSGRWARRGGFVTLVLVAEWLGHAGSWWLSGGVGPGHALSGPMHSYLGPVGVVLALLAATMSGIIWACLTGLSRWTEAACRALAQAWRADLVLRHQAGAVAESPACERRAGPMQIWGALVSVQLVLYVVQENLELRLLGRPDAGMHVLTAHHGLPLLVHGAVAFGAMLVALLLSERWDEGLARARGVACLYIRLAAPLTPVVAWPGPRRAAARPRTLFGFSFAARPPPGRMVT
jgi:hypothetical protein